MLIDYNKYNLIFILFIALVLSSCSANNIRNTESVDNENYIKTENLVSKVQDQKEAQLDIAIFFETPQQLDYCIEKLKNTSNKEIKIFPVNLLNEKEVANFFSSDSKIKTIIILSENNEKVSLLAKIINTEAIIFTTASYKKPNVYNISLSLKNKIYKLLEILEPQTYVIPIFSNPEKVEYEWRILKDTIAEIEDIHLIDIVGYHTNQIYLNKKESIISKIISYITLLSVSEDNRKYVLLVLDDLTSAKEYLKLIKASSFQLKLISTEFSKDQVFDIITLKGNELNREKALIYDLFSVIRKSKMDFPAINSNEFTGINGNFIFKKNHAQYLLEINGEN